MKLSLIIPVYNEKNRYYEGIKHFQNYLKNQEYSWEIIIVNDGSTDDTLSLIKKSSRGLKNIKIVSYKQNHGKGFAIAKGVEKAKGEIILFSDIDHSVSINSIENFFPYFNKGYSAVIGSRRIKGANIEVRQNIIRESLGRGFTFLVKSMIDSKINDATCGFKAFKKNVAKKIFNQITIYDWAFDAEIIFLLKKMDAKVAQAPVTWRNVKDSKVALKKDILNSLLGLFRIRFNDLLGKYQIS